MRQQSHFRLPILLVPIRAANSTHLPFHGKLPNNFCFPIRYKFPLIFLKKLRFGQILSWHTSHYIFLCLIIHISETYFCTKYQKISKIFFQLQDVFKFDICSTVSCKCTWVVFLCNYCMFLTFVVVYIYIYIYIYMGPPWSC